MVRLVYEEGGLRITTYASALQAGAAGDLISVRNSESGLVCERHHPGGIHGQHPYRYELMRWIFAALAFLSMMTASDAAVRIKDIVQVEGIRDNQLIGYGLVIGLQGTGDTLRNAPFTEQSMQSMLDRLGINVRNTSLRTRNVAAVLVTRRPSPFHEPRIAN